MELCSFGYCCNSFNNGAKEMKLSKAIIKKYGITKKAWAIQKKQKGSSTKRIKTRFKTMAKKRTYRKSSSMFGSLNTPIMGAAGVVLYESLLSPMIPLQGTAKDLLEMVGGLYLSKKRGMLGATGKSLVVINSYQLISGLVGTKLQGLISTTPTASYNYGGY